MTDQTSNPTAPHDPTTTHHDPMPTDTTARELAAAIVAWEAFHPPMDDPDRPDPAGTLSGSEWYAYALRHAERVIRARAADITEEPPAGSQVTDCEGDVWGRREGGWTIWSPGRPGWLADLYESALDSWPVVRISAPLRPTTDADRERVGLPVEPAPADVDPEPKAELDEVEALAKVLRLTAGRPGFSFPWEAITQEARDEYLNLARAAREHIEAEDAAAHPVGCGQMIRDVRDGNGFSTQTDGVLIAKCDTYGRTKSESVANARADKAEAERDALKAKADRYEALRDDVEEVVHEHRTSTVTRRLADALARDTERAES